MAYFKKELLPLVKEHPHQQRHAVEQMQAAGREWVGAATVAAAQNPELQEYAATCGARVHGPIARLWMAGSAR